MPYGTGTYCKQVGRPPSKQKASKRKAPNTRELVIAKMKTSNVPKRRYS